MTPEAPVNSEYREMSATDLARRINAAYEEVLSSERTNLPRAKAIGEKLTWLKAKTSHGKWKTKLAEWCPKLRYETANRYMRVYIKWLLIERAAAAKHVVTTSLTIEDALDLIAKPRKPEADKPEDDSSDDESRTGSSGSGSSRAPTNEDIGKDWLKALAVDELVIWLSGLHDDQYLAELCAALTELLKPPLPKPTTAQQDKSAAETFRPRV